MENRINKQSAAINFGVSVGNTIVALTTTGSVTIYAAFAAVTFALGLYSLLSWAENSRSSTRLEASQTPPDNPAEEVTKRG